MTVELDPDDPLFAPIPLPVRCTKVGEEIIGRRWVPIDLAWLFHSRYQPVFPPVARLYLYLWVASNQGRLAGRLTNEVVGDLSIDRRRKYRCLKELEVAGLIRVVRGGQKAPIVTLVAVGVSQERSISPPTMK